MAVALLIYRDQSERVVPVSEPPPTTYSIAIPQRLNITEPDREPHYEPIPRRTFTLSRFRTPEHRWWRVYNEGRSQTPEDGYVYLEVPAAEILNENGTLPPCGKNA